MLAFHLTDKPSEGQTTIQTNKLTDGPTNLQRDKRALIHQKTDNPTDALTHKRSSRMELQFH